MTGIRLRAAVAIVEDGRILLVPHFDTDAGPIQWMIPGGGVEFGERIETAAVRECREETGLDVTCDSLLEVYENIRLSPPWHSVTFFYRGHIDGGVMAQEETPWGPRTPRWFGIDELAGLVYYPPQIVEKILRTSDSK